MAFANRPRVIVLDEPTTGLDVTTQAHVLETVRALCAAHGVAAVYVSHDLAVVATLATRVAVMYGGRLVELGPTGTLFRHAAHPYTRRLVEAIPELSGQHALVGIPGTAPRPGHRPTGCFFAPRCTYAVDRCRTEFPPRRAGRRRPRGALLRARERARRLAGCAAGRGAAPRGGRRELARRGAGGRRRARPTAGALRCRPPASARTSASRSSASRARARRRSRAASRACTATYDGEISFRGRPLPPGARARDRETRREIQYVFQSPYSSLNPRKSIGQIIGQPLRLFFDLSGREARARTAEVLETRPAQPVRRRALPASPVGRRAPARRDRTSARRQSAAAHLRRGHVGARRLRAGRDRRPARRAAARARTRPALRHAQPRAHPDDRAGGGRHERGAHRRARPRRRRARPSTGRYTQEAALRHAEPRGRGRRFAPRARGRPRRARAPPARRAAAPGTRRPRSTSCQRRAFSSSAIFSSKPGGIWSERSVKITMPARTGDANELVEGRRRCVARRQHTRGDDCRRSVPSPYSRASPSRPVRRSS